MACFSFGWGTECAGPIRQIAVLSVIRFLDLLSKLGSDGCSQMIQHGPQIVENILEQILEIQFCIHLGHFSFHVVTEMLCSCPSMEVEIF